MSHALLDQLKSALSPELVSDTARSLNEPLEATEQAIGSALPALIAAIAGATRMPSGLSAVMRMMEDPINDGTLSTQLASLYKGTMVAAPIYRLGSQLLQTVLGNRQQQLSQAIAALSGVRPASAGALLHVLAPHVLDVIGRDHRAVADKSAEGFARYMEQQKGKVAGLLPEPLAELLNGSAAAGAAKTVASTAGATTAAAAIAAGASTASAAAKSQASQSAPQKPAAAVAAVSSQKAAAVSKPKGKPANVAGLRDADSRWGLVYLIAFFGIALFGIAFGLLGQLDSDGSKPVASTAPATPAAVAPAPAQPPAPQKAAEVKPAEVKPKPPAPVAPAVPAPAVKAAEATGPVSKDSKPQPGKTADAAVAASKDGKEAKAPIKKDGKESKTKVAVAAPINVPPNNIAPAVPGATHYYGTSKPVAEMPAVANPDYKPAAPAPSAAIPPDNIAPVVHGVTSYYGGGKAAAEMPAVANPDYKPAVAAASVAATADAAAPVVVPGATSYYGTGKSPPEMPAILNPDYKPAAPAPAAVAATADKPAATVPGATQYYGVSAPTAEAPAVRNPDYKAGAKMAAAIAAAADGKAAKIAPPAKAKVSTSPSGGVTTYYGASPQVSSQSCSDAVATAVKSGTVLFRSGSADLTASSLPVLKRVAKAFRDCQGVKLSIGGHTDDSGGADMNQRLSEMRAKAVWGYLTLRGVDAGRIASAGYGASRPVAPNTSAENKAKNRRIEFTVDTL